MTVNLKKAEDSDTSNVQAVPVKTVLLLNCTGCAVLKQVILCHTIPTSHYKKFRHYIATLESQH